MSLGLGPASNVCSTRPVVAAISINVSSKRLVTQTAPGLRATPVGPLPTGMYLRILSVSGLIQSSFRVPLQTTHSDPCPNASAVGSRSTGITSCTDDAFGSTRDTESSKTLATQSE